MEAVTGPARPTPFLGLDQVGQRGEPVGAESDRDLFTRRHNFRGLPFSRSHSHYLGSPNSMPGRF